MGNFCRYLAIVCARRKKIENGAILLRVGRLHRARSGSNVAGPVGSSPIRARSSTACGQDCYHTTCTSHGGSVFYRHVTIRLVFRRARLNGIVGLARRVQFIYVIRLVAPIRPRLYLNANRVGALAAALGHWSILNETVLCGAFKCMGHPLRLVFFCLRCADGKELLRLPS